MIFIGGVGWVWSRNVDVYPEYLRKEWKHWTDADGDCQGTGQEALIEESEIPVTFMSPEECKMASGHWSDPYSGRIGSIDGGVSGQILEDRTVRMMTSSNALSKRISLGCDLRLRKHRCAARRPPESCARWHRWFALVSTLVVVLQIRDDTSDLGARNSF